MFGSVCIIHIVIWMSISKLYKVRVFGSVLTPGPCCGVTLFIHESILSIAFTFMIGTLIMNIFFSMHSRISL
jgi:hypothetical protein